MKAVLRYNRDNLRRQVKDLSATIAKIMGINGRVRRMDSMIRNNYHLENMPRGKQRGRFFFGCNIIS